MASSSSSSRARGENAVPVDFLCPILQQVMQNPSIAADGYSYEREAIEDWFKRSGKSPMTNVELPSKELRDNRALKAAIEAYLHATGKLASEVDALTRSNVDKDACLRALEADLKRAEANKGMQVNLLEHERLVSEVSMLKSRLRFAEETLAEAKPCKRRRVSEMGEEENRGEQSSSSGDVPPQASASDEGSAEDAPDDVKSHIADLIDATRIEVAAKKQRLNAKLAFLKNSREEALATTERVGKAVAEQDKEVEQDEAKVTSARVKLSAIHVDMEEKLKERDAKAKLCIEQAKSFGLPTVPDNLLQQVQESPQDYKNGHLGEYASLHLEWKALREQHGQKMSCISAVEAAANASRAASEALKARWEAAKEILQKVDKEVAEAQTAMTEVEREASGLDSRRDQLLKSFDAAFGPGGALPSAAATLPPSNLTLLPMLDAILTTRFARQQDALQEKLDEQEEKLKRNFVRLCKPPASRVLEDDVDLTVEDLVGFGYTTKELLDGGCCVSDVLDADCSHEEVAKVLCKPLPPSPEASKGAVVTHVFASPSIQSMRDTGEMLSLISPEQCFAAVDSASWRYCFRISFRPNGKTEESKGAFGLNFMLQEGADPSSLTWPMPKESFTLKLRLLARAGCSSPHCEHTLDGMKNARFANYLKDLAPPSPGVGLSYGCASLVSPTAASSGDFFLGPDKDAVAVQIELCLRQSGIVHIP
mmetsp:Transcript_75953/g.180612  ORF Transcript_75953/g.180612 Transcript_75953/m.180612 type:complete len:709 (-) Transcript_75953:96-2222(-)